MAALPSLPVEMLEVKIKLQATKKTKRFSVSGVHNTSETVIKTERLSFDPRSSLVFTSLDTPFVVLYADVFVFNGDALITRESMDDLTGVDGRDAPLTPATKPGAGRNGNNGQPGGNGSAAQNPKRMPVFFMFARQFLWVNRQAVPSDVRDRVSIVMNGLDGGVGGNGGRGGDGTNGNKGESPSPGPIWCNSGVGWGGRGGNGGAGGLKGFGSIGGDASAVYFIVDPQQNAVASALTVSTLGGQPGEHGQHGQPGKPGRGGAPGDGKGSCSDEPGRRGADGQITEGCQFPEIDLWKGADHKNSPGIFDYDGWSELETIS